LHLLQRKPYRSKVDLPEDLPGSREPRAPTGCFGTRNMLHHANKAKRSLKPDRWSGV